MSYCFSSIFTRVRTHRVLIATTIAIIIGILPTTALAEVMTDAVSDTSHPIDYAKAFALLRDENYEDLLESVFGRFSHSRVFPIEGSSTYECGLGCFCGTHGGNHQGQDFGTQGATPPAVSIADGTVVAAGWDSGYGNLIAIDHGDGTVSRYAHLNEIFVSVGQPVAQGDQIGLVGSTGFAEGNHLHFEIIIDGITQNPLVYL